ncbi:endonuclease/exonuclease/phosphatase family protein [Novosphingobium sp. BL-8A]|uniref:endonuclease/exonuclease/phosphatase family protein n=1 Tax=Novosphingobium sp. BL-8A TaxID=3127639 RepID=UPI0037570E04
MVGAGLLVLAAGRLGGAFPLLDMANLAALPAALLVVLGSLSLMVRRRTTSARVIGACGLVLGLLATLPAGAVPSRCAPSAPRLRVAWINAHGPVAPEPIASWVAQEHPQILGFAELEKSSKDMRAMMAERFAHHRSCLPNGRCSTMLFTHIAPSEAESLAHGDPENRRALSAVRMGFADGGALGSFSVIALHLSHPLPLGRQQEELLEAQAALADPANAIVMGDFNLSPRMWTLRDFAARNGLTVTRASRPTWPASWNGMTNPGLWQIDHLLVGRNWQVESLRVSPDLGSDHRGYVADLCRPDTGPVPAGQS